MSNAHYGWKCVVCGEYNTGIIKTSAILWAADHNKNQHAGVGIGVWFNMDYE